MKRSDRRAACVLACLLLPGLSACGGGGGGGGESLSVSFTQNPLQVSKYQWDLPVHVPVTATVTGSTSASTLYVYIVDQGNTFATGQVPISQTGPDTYQATFNLPASTSVGEHDSNLQLRICADANCNQVLDNSTLPYKVAVQPNPTVQAVATPSTLVGQAITTGSASSGYVDALSLRLPVFQFTGTPVYPIYVKASDSARNLSLPYDQYSTSNSLIAGPFNQANFQLVFQGADTLAPGTYSGQLTLTFCHDQKCSKVFGGSSTLPYTLSYGAGSLGPLAAAAGASDWTGVNGGPGHNASVPMTVAQDTLTPRWLVNAGNGYSSTADPRPVTGGGKVFVAQGNVSAFNESDGSPAWSVSPAPTGPLASAGGMLYIESNGLYGIAESDGHQIFANTAAAANYYYIGPTALGNTVLEMGPDNRIAAYNGQTGASQGAPACLQAIAQAGGVNTASVALDAQLNAYIDTGTSLAVANFGATQTCSQIGNGNNNNATPMLVPGNADVVLNLGAGLVDLDTANAITHWTTAAIPPQTLVASDGAIANGVIYALAQNPFAYYEVQAYSEATGQLLWSWTLPEPFSETIPATGMIVTGNTLFVQGYAHVYALDLTSHQAEWSLDTAGSIAISANGILYSNSTNVGPDVNHTRLVAVNLH